MKSKVEWFLIIFILSVASVTIVLAAPTGPSSVTNIGSSRYSSPGGANVSALAGNVTEINFVANTITKQAVRIKLLL